MASSPECLHRHRLPVNLINRSLFPNPMRRMADIKSELDGCRDFYVLTRTEARIESNGFFSSMIKQGDLRSLRDLLLFFPPKLTSTAPLPLHAGHHLPCDHIPQKNQDSKASDQHVLLMTFAQRLSTASRRYSLWVKAMACLSKR